MDDLCKTQNHSVMKVILQTRQKVFFAGLLFLFSIQINAQRANLEVLKDKDAPRKVLRETNREELMRISHALENEHISRRKSIEEFARKNNFEIRRELPNGKVLELVNVENGQPWFYVTHNIGAAITTRANQLWSGGRLGLNLDGSSIPAIGVWDAGVVLSTHQEFMSSNKSRITQKDNATSVSNHATHVAGTLVANGITSKARGMANNATVFAYNWSLDASEMAAAAAEGMLISNHSYGYTYGWLGSNWYGNSNISTQEDYRFGFYSTVSRSWDNIAYNAPYYLIVKSAGNDRNEGPTDGLYPKDGFPDGFDCIGTDAIGKNILTVGNVSQVSSYTGPSSVVMSSNSAWGPADDGRIKPDVVGNGVMIYSTTGSSPSAYATMSGTSMASPNVAGTLALLQEYFMQLNGTFMRSATLKGLTIHTTDEAGPADGPDFMFGWGLVNAERAAQIIAANQTNNISIQELSLANNGYYQIQVYSDGTQPLKATIVWTDPAGNALSPALDPVTPALVHDLDLVISGKNTNFFPWKLDRNNPSAPAARTSKNYVDNVEVVLIDNPTPGEYTIKVTHDGVLSSNQDFSLIISGARKNTVTAPIADFSADKTSVIVGDYVQFTNLSANNPSSYKWEFNGAEVSTSNEANPKVKFISEGTFTIKLTATNSAGSNTKTLTGYISVRAASVKADFVASSTSITEGGSVTFTDKSLNNPTSWSWTFQGGTPATSTAQNPKVSYSKSGLYDVTLKVTNANGSDQVVKSGFIAVAMKAPVAGFTADKTEIFIGESVQFTDQSQNAQSFIWTFEGGTPATSNQQNPIVSYSTAGTYSVRQEVTNSTGSDAKTVSGMITVKNLPVKADFTASVTSITEGGSVTFTDKSLNNPTSWSWTFQGGTPATSTAQNPKVSYSKSGLYDVTLKVTNANGSDQVVKSGYIAVVINLPVAGFTVANSEILVGTSVPFIDQSENAVTYNWVFDGGTPATSTQKNPIVTYNSIGKYSVTQKVNNSSGSDTKLVSSMITVKPLPVSANFSVSTTTITEGSKVIFNDLSTNTPISWNWSFNGGTPSVSNEQHPEVTYSKPGIYDVSLIVSNGVESDIMIRTGYIVVTMKLPVAEFSFDKSEIIEGEPIQFKDLSQNAQTYAWTFEGGTPATSKENNPLVTYNKAGLYSVSLKVTNSSGSDTKIKNASIIVKVPPVDADFSSTTTLITEGESVEFYDKSKNNPISWNWSFPGGNPSVSTERNPKVSYSKSGKYDVTLRVQGFNGSDELIRTGYINVSMKAPVADFIGSVTEIYAGEIVSFINLSQNAQSFSWQFEGGSVLASTEKNPDVKYSIPGSYAVSLIASNEMGSSTKTRLNYIVVKPLPVIADFIASSTSITEGGTISFNNLSSNNPTWWNWTFQGGTPAVSSEKNPEVIYSKAGKYDVTLTAGNANGSNTIIKEGFIVVGMNIPKADFSADKTEIMAGEKIQFTDQSINAQSYDWTIQGGTPSVSTEKNPLVTFNTAGTFTVTQKVTNVAGSATKSISITVKPLQVTADFAASATTVTAGESVSFTDLSINNPTSWNWTFAGGNPASSTEKDPKVTYNNSGRYDVSLTVSNAYGTHTLTRSVYISVVMKAPVASFTTDRTNILAGESVQFTNQSQDALTFEWTFNGGTPSASTEKNPLVKYNTKGLYAVKLVVSNTTNSDILIKEGYIKVENLQETYPEASSLNAANEWIQTVSVGNFVNRNSGPSTYSDFTDKRIALSEGISYSLTLSPGNNGTRNPLNWKIWIDYNNDKDFDDKGEEIFSATGLKNNANGKISIPNGTAPLITRMRIAMRHGGIPVSWGSFERGEVEDYTVEIITNNSSRSEEQGLTLKEPAFKAYPNPARDNLFIQLDNWTEPYNVKMTDLSGRVMYNQKTSDNIILIDVSGFNKGLYILTVTDGKNTNSQRVTVH